MNSPFTTLGASCFFLLLLIFVSITVLRNVIEFHSFHRVESPYYHSDYAYLVFLLTICVAKL